MGIMGTRVSKVAFLLVTAAFFAALALDITVPALVLCGMSLTNWVVLNGAMPRLSRGNAA